MPAWPPCVVVGISIAISRSVTVGRLHELRLMREVVLPRLFFGDLQLLADFVLLHAVDRDLTLEILPQVVHRHALLRSAALNFASSSRFWFLRSSASQSLNCWSVTWIALFLPELEQQHLVDRVDQDLAA